MAPEPSQSPGTDTAPPTYYSQPHVQNDRWVVEVALGFQRGGYFVEAGAYDGVEMSNTCVLEREFEWTGLCVEPNPRLFQQLAKNRRCLCEPVGLYSHEGIQTFIDAGGLGGIGEHIRHPDQAIGGSYQARCTTLVELLDRRSAPSVIDYLSLDTEGTEFEILKDFPFDRYAFRCVTIESWDCEDLLLSNGYLSVANPFNTQNTWERYYRHPGG